MKRHRVQLMYYLCAAIWGFLAIMEYFEHDPWHHIIFHASLGILWFMLAYRFERNGNHEK